MELALDKIKFKTIEEKDCLMTFAVQIAPEAVKDREEEVTLQFQKAAHLPGFRAGKAPIDLVRKNFSGKVKSEAVEQLIKDAVPKVLKEKSVTPVAAPVVEKLEISNEQRLTFNLKVEKNPEFKVKNYNKIPAVKKTKKNFDADLEKELNLLRERSAQLVPSADETAQKHHFTVIDYQGFHNNQPVADLKAANQLIDLSTPQFIAGFAEGILGAKKGETREIKVRFPQEHPRKNLAGEEIAFKVTVREIKEKKLPNADDEFAKDLGLTSHEELKTKMLEGIKKNWEKSQESEVQKQIFDYLVKEFPIPVPPSLINYQLESLMRHALELAYRQGGITPEQWEQNRPALEEKYKPQAERQVRLTYLLNAIAKNESIQATEEEFLGDLEKAQLGRRERGQEIEKYFLEHKETILRQIAEEKVIKYLIEHAKIKESEEK